VGAQNAQIWMASVAIAIEPTPTQNGGYLRAQLLFQLDLSTPARPRPVASLFMIAKRSNVLSSA
jgi:hypothetical protein